MIVTKTSEKI